VAEEYFWAMTQEVVRSCCTGSGSCVFWNLDSKWTPLHVRTYVWVYVGKFYVCMYECMCVSMCVYIYIMSTIYMYIHFRLAPNSTSTSSSVP